MTTFAPIYYPYLAISDSCMRMNFLIEQDDLFFRTNFESYGDLFFWNEGSTLSTGGNQPGSVNIVPVVKNSFCTNTNSALVPVVKVKKTNKMFLRSNMCIGSACYHQLLLPSVANQDKKILETPGRNQNFYWPGCTMHIYICN